MAAALSLFVLWVFQQGAESLGAREEWQGCFQDARSDDAQSPAPTFVVLDAETFDAAELLNVPLLGCGAPVRDTAQLRRDRSPMIAAWWLVVWKATCKEISFRFGVERRVCRARSDLRFTMEEFYKKLFRDGPANTHSPESSARDDELSAIWDDLVLFEQIRGRGLSKKDLGRFKHQEQGRPRDKFDRQTLHTFWRHATTAWNDGWPIVGASGIALDVQTGSGSGIVTATGQPGADIDVTSFTHVPPHKVKSLDGGIYAWRQFKVQAETKEEAQYLLDGKWFELQHRTACAKLVAQQRKDVLLRSMPADAHQRPGTVTSLRHDRHQEIFRGRLFEDGQKLVFEEESSWLRVEVEPPSDLTGRALDTWRRNTLYERLRARHVAAKREASRAAT